MKKRMNLLTKRLSVNQIAVCAVSDENYNTIENVNFNATTDFANLIEVDLVSYNTFGKAMWSVTFYCENRYIAAYIIKLMRKDVRHSTFSLVQNTELAKLIDNQDIYDRVVNWKAANSIYVIHRNEFNSLGNVPAKHYNLPVFYSKDVD